MPDPSILDCNTVMCNTILIAAILSSPPRTQMTGQVALASRCPAPLPWLPAATTVETQCLGPLTAELGGVSRGECPHCCSAAVLQAPALFRDQEVTPGAGAVVCGEQGPGTQLQ